MVLTLGVIGGSGLLKTKLAALQRLTECRVETVHGAVVLRLGELPALQPSGEAVRLVFVQRHDARPSREYTQPADINYPARALALQAQGCDAVVGVCSVGAMFSANMQSAGSSACTATQAAGSDAFIASTTQRMSLP